MPDYMTQSMSLNALPVKMYYRKQSVPHPNHNETGAFTNLARANYAAFNHLNAGQAALIVPGAYMSGQGVPANGVLIPGVYPNVADNVEAHDDVVTDDGVIEADDGVAAELFIAPVKGTITIGANTFKYIEVQYGAGAGQRGITVYGVGDPRTYKLSPNPHNEAWYNKNQATFYKVVAQAICNAYTAAAGLPAYNAIQVTPKGVEYDLIDPNA